MTSDPIARYLTQRTAKMDRRNRLRIMTGNEIVDVAIRVYQVLGWTFLKLSIIPSLFCLAAVSFFLYVWPDYFVTQHPGSEVGQFGELISNTGLILFVAAPLFVLGISYTSVVVTQIVSDYMVGNVPSPEAAEARGRLLLPKLFWLNMREILMACGGIIGALAILVLAAHLGYSTDSSDPIAGVVLLLAIVGFGGGAIMFLWVLSRHSLAPAVLTLEDTSIGEAAKRSSALLKAYGMHPSGSPGVWGLYVLLSLLFLLVWGGISLSLATFDIGALIQHGIRGIPLAPVISGAVSMLPVLLTIWTLTPVWSVATTIIYYDRRIRLEGYDIEALAEDVWRADRSRRFDL